MAAPSLNNFQDRITNHMENIASKIKTQRIEILKMEINMDH